MVGEALRAGTLSWNGFIVSCFQLETLGRVRQIDESLPIALLTKGLPSPSFWKNARQLGAVSVHIDVEAVTAFFVNQAHDSGLRVMVYTVNSPQDARRLLDIGVDGIFSDFPDRVHP